MSALRRWLTAVLTAACGVELEAHAQAAPATDVASHTLTPPRLISEPDIGYPEGATGEARVELILLVDAEGSVVEAIPTEPNEPFSTHAAEGVRKLEFRPAMQDGRPRSARIRFEVVFHPPAPEPEAPPGQGEPDDAGKDAALDGVRVQGAPRARPAPAREVVLVPGERPEPSRSASFSRAEVRQLPGAFGDPFRAIEAMPGVTPIATGLPFFFVRGAPPGNAGYFLDGVRVPLLFHVGIGPSVVHPALMDRVDLYPGGYPARFGRFAGGIVAGETKAPGTRLHGEYNARLFDAGALVEAPFAGQRGAVLLGGRYSYTAALLSLVSPETSLDYWDYQARLSFELGAGDRVEAFAFGSYDFLGEKTQSEAITLFGAEFHRLDLRFDRTLDRGRLRLGVTGGLDRSELRRERSVRQRLVGIRSELDYQLSENVTLRAGTDLDVGTYDVILGPGDLSPEAAQAAEFFPSRTDIASGVQGDLVIRVDESLQVTPGLRLDLYDSDGAAALGIDPRMALRAQASERIALLSALGVAHQPPAFVVPVPGFQPGGLRGGLQRALQYSFGIELALARATTFTATVFQNAFFEMSDPLGVSEPELDGCPPGTFPSGTLAGDRGEEPPDSPDCGPRFEPGTLGPDRSGGGGQAAGSPFGRRAVEAFEVRTLGAAYGLELLLKRRLSEKLGGLLSYTLSRSTRSYAERRYVATFDRTHVLNAVLAYDLGHGFRAGARAVFYTGLPRARAAGDTGPDRLPAFFRLDGRFEKRWRVWDASTIALVFEWMNATFSTESLATECTLSGCVPEEIGPVTIPSIGVEGVF